MAWNILGKLGIDSASELIGHVGEAAGSVMDRVGFTKKLSEAERIDKYSTLFKISEDSTDSARRMFMAEMQTQKMPWLIKFLNGIVRPFGGIGALLTEFYAIWGANLGVWFGLPYIEVEISMEQHLVLGAIIAFYFGSRLSEVKKGVATKR